MLYGPRHGGSQINTDGGVLTGGTQGEGTGTGRRDLLGYRDGLERTRIGMTGVVGMVAREGKTTSVSRVCVGVWAVLCRGVGKAGRR